MGFITKRRRGRTPGRPEDIVGFAIYIIRNTKYRDFGSKTEKKRENASISNIRGPNKRIYLLPKMYN